MIIKVNPHKCEIEKSPVNEKEINITKCEFEFSEEITSNYVKDVYFTLNDTTIKVANIQNNACDIPYEVLTHKGMVEIGVVAYLVENETEIKRYNPSPVYIDTLFGSLKDNFDNYEAVTPTDKEQIEQMLNNIDIDGEKSGEIVTITITKKDGTQETLQLEDGMGLNYNWSGTYLGIKREDETNYQYVDLKGEKGEPGAIKMNIVNELPLTGASDTIYLVPLQTPESQENNYAEYIYINNNWELLGKIGIQVDLTDYYTKQEVNALIPDELSDLRDDSTHRLVTDTEKTAWNNKQNALVFDDTPTQNSNNPVKSGGIYTYINTIIGDINTAIDLLNGEVI